MTFSKGNWCFVLLQQPANCQIVHTEIVNRTIIIRYKAGKTSVILLSSMYELKCFASYPEIFSITGVGFLRKKVSSAFFSVSHLFFFFFSVCFLHLIHSSLFLWLHMLKISHCVCHRPTVKWLILVPHFANLDPPLLSG